MSVRSSAIAAGLCGGLFVAYCIYFDKKRRSDPKFKEKLRERRIKKHAAEKKGSRTKVKLPNLHDSEAVHKFFLDEIQLGDECISKGDFHQGSDHLINAIAVCGQPHQLLQILQQTLPTPVFQMLLYKLPTINQQIVT